MLPFALDRLEVNFLFIAKSVPLFSSLLLRLHYLFSLFFGSCFRRDDFLHKLSLFFGYGQVFYSFPPPD